VGDALGGHIGGPHMEEHNRGTLCGGPPAGGFGDPLEEPTLGEAFWGPHIGDALREKTQVGTALGDII
jgi:hypothetical protein